VIEDFTTLARDEEIRKRAGRIFPVAKTTGDRFERLEHVGRELWAGSIATILANIAMEGQLRRLEGEVAEMNALWRANKG
jgi:hypothetical protein